MRLAAILCLTLMATAAHAASDGFARKTVGVAAHVHLIYRPIATNAPYEGNSVVIEQSDGLVVVDAGGAPPAGRHIVAAIKAFSSKPVKFIVYTHYHGDHNLGAGELLRAWPHAVTISTAATWRNMTGKPMDYVKTYGQDYQAAIDAIRQKLADPSQPEAMRRGRAQYVDVGDSIVKGFTGLKVYPAMLTFSDTLTIPDASEPVEIAFLGKANTDGDAIVWVPNEKVLAAGDVVVHPFPYAGASFPTSWIAVLNKLKGYGYAYLVPGHGEVQTDTAYIDKVIAALETVRAQVAPLAKKGVPLEDVYNQTDFEALTASFTGDDKWLRTLFNAFFLHSLIKNAYFEATNQAIEQGTQ